MFKILVVEDDSDLQGLFCRALEKHGYDAAGAEHASLALKLLEEEPFDLAITDVMLPGMDGFSLVQEIRSRGLELPILIITAKGTLLDKETGFHAGADDYMVKPIDINEMILRVEALLRRAKSIRERVLTFGSTTLDYASLTVTDGNGSLMLPQKEFLLLFRLLSYPGKIFTRQQLLDDIWGAGEVTDSHTLDVHISRLRERFRNNEDFEIVTIRGLGYRAVKR